MMMMKAKAEDGGGGEGGGEGKISLRDSSLHLARFLFEFCWALCGKKKR